MEDAAGDVGPHPAVASASDVEDVELDSVTLARLLAEVRNDERVETNAYNRMHNRHNR